MEKPIKIIHYLNQFFGGIGGEEKADAPPAYRSGPVGPGVALARHLGDNGSIVGTVICGDNYFIEHEKDALARLMEMAADSGADVLVAGPAFNSGRYGTACGALVQAWRSAGKPGLTAMNVNNPGVELYRNDVYILPTGDTVASMNKALADLANFAIKLAEGREIGPAYDEGYFSTGLRRNLRLPQGAAERAVDMLLAKLAGKPFQSELPVPDFSNVDPAPPATDLANAKVALVTESGLVPFGNPDKLETWNASKWLKYPIAGLDALRQGQYEAWHGGCDTAGTNADPHRAVPLDAARALVKAGVIGSLCDHYYVTTGNMANIKVMERIGREMAEDMKSQGVEAVILTAT